MSNKISLVVFCLFLSVALSAEEHCEKIKIKYIENQDEKMTQVEACLDKDERDRYIYSKSCQGLKCRVLSKPEARPVSLKDYKSSIGSPGFKVCRELKGSPQIFSYKYLGKWYKTDRCLFENGSFASTNLIFKLWDGFILR